MYLMKVTKNNISSFIEGNWFYYKDKLVGSPRYIVEQVYYRLFLCKDDCVPNNACIYCTCPPVKKSWVQKSCNGGVRFPDQMDKDTWEEFKITNNINVNDFLDD